MRRVFRHLFHHVTFWVDYEEYVWYAGADYTLEWD